VINQAQVTDLGYRGREKNHPVAHLCEVGTRRARSRTYCPLRITRTCPDRWHPFLLVFHLRILPGRAIFSPFQPPIPALRRCAGSRRPAPDAVLRSIAADSSAHGTPLSLVRNVHGNVSNGVTISKEKGELLIE
jgi:hypothetical protein